MRHFRLIAGFLTLSLILGGVLGDFFHVQERNETQASAHSVAHTDSVDVDDTDLYALDSETGDGCYETGTQIAIAPAGQHLTSANVVGIFPSLNTAIVHCQREVAHIFSGRSAPLFEHASLFASTVSMRV